MCLIAGESAGLVKDIKPAGQIVQEMMEEARQVIERPTEASASGRNVDNDGLRVLMF